MLDSGKRRSRRQLYKLAAFPRQYFELKDDNRYGAAMSQFLDGVLR